MRYPFPRRLPLRAAIAIGVVIAGGAAWPVAAPAAPVRPAPDAQAAAPAPMLAKAQDVAIFALGLIGIEYRFGGDSPHRGLDCSGLVRYVFSHTTGIDLPRTSAQQGKVGVGVARVELAPGDLVFFNTRRFVHSHVGIYLGGNRFVHAPSRGGEVEIASLDNAYWKKRFDGARRVVGVVGANAAQAATAPADDATMPDAAAWVPIAQTPPAWQVDLTP